MLRVPAGVVVACRVVAGTAAACRAVAGTAAACRVVGGTAAAGRVVAVVGGMVVAGTADGMVDAAGAGAAGGGLPPSSVVWLSAPP